MSKNIFEEKTVYIDELVKENMPEGLNLKFENMTVLTDEDLNKSTAESLKNNDCYNITRRNDSSTEFFQLFVTAYENNTKTNRNLKRAFFVMFMIFLSIMIGIVPTVIVIASCNNNIHFVEILTALVSSSATIITSIIIIPKIMVQQLFSSEETKVSIDLISKLLETDKKTREIHESTNIIHKKAED